MNKELIFDENIKKYARFGMSFPWISRKTGISLSKLRRGLKSGALTKPPESKKKYYCNYDFFKKIETEKQAYWLGMLMADGCITDRGGVYLSLKADDYQIIEQFKMDLEAEHPVEFNTSIVRFKNYDHDTVQRTVKLRINSLEMTQDLARLGVSPRKSFSTQFPTFDQVPRELMNHFVRGYFDGDGSIYFSKNKWHGTWGFSIISSCDFVKSCSEHLNRELGLEGCEIKPHPTSYGMAYLAYRRYLEIGKLKGYLYENATVYLNRKKEKFDKYEDRDFMNLRQKITQTLSQEMEKRGVSEVTSFEVAEWYKAEKDVAWHVLRQMFKTGKMIRKKISGKIRTHSYEPC